MSDEDYEQARQRVHEALGSLLDDGEIAISWVLTIDVAGPDGVRYLAHRGGGGHDGADAPMAWAAAGMLQAAADLARQQLLDMATGPDGPEPDDE